MHPLTKTNYLAYLSCPEELWMEINLPEYQDITPSPEVLYQMQQGNLIDRLGADYLEQVVLPGSIGEGQTVNRQRGFQTKHFEARADVTIEHTANGIIDIYEVKSSTKIKEEHLRDVAFQRLVIEAAGYQVGTCHLVYVDKTYKMAGELNLAALFCLEEITAWVEAIFREVRTEALAASKFINGPEPEARILANSPDKLDSIFTKRHFEDLPAYSIFDISRLGIQKREELLARGILNIQDVPSDFPLSPKQRQQVELAQQKSIFIDQLTIKIDLDQLEYPLYFLDYETLARALPLQDGHRPHQQMLFQYSLHVIQAPNSAVKHYEYLLPDQKASILELLSNLQTQLGTDKGRVVVWNKSFERKINTTYASIYPEYADFLLSINHRIYDLMEIFQKGHYRHPDFKGKYSLKRVLPVLCPELSYEDLHIKKGTEANVTWYCRLPKGSYQNLVERKYYLS